MIFGMKYVLEICNQKIF